VESQTEMVPSIEATPGLLEMLRVLPAMGRTFISDEGEIGASHVAILSDAAWKGRFAGRPDILGQTIRANEETYSIIGVMPPAFRFHPDQQEQIYVPLTRDPDRSHGFLRVVGRLRPGVSISQAQSEMNAITERATAQYSNTNRYVGANVEPLVDALVGNVRTGLLILLGVVALVLLIACTNVANLMLARSASRQKEFAVRAALGAGRRRLAQQLLAESIILSLAGGALGLLLSSVTARLLAVLLSKQFQIPRIESTGTDARVLAFTLVISVAAGILFGAAPALSTGSADLNQGLREASRSATESTRGRRTRGLLVITETALALVLLVAAGLLLKSFLSMQSTQPGFQTANRLAIAFRLPRLKFARLPDRMRFFDELLSSVKATPGVRSAALVADLPFGGGSDSLGFHIPGRPDPAPGTAFSANFNIVSAGYFQTMGIPLIAGREFNLQENGSTPATVVINEAAARELWPGEDALARQISLPGPDNTSTTLTVAGVAGDVRQSDLARRPAPEIFLNYTQANLPWLWLTMVAHTEGDALAMAATVKSVAAAVDTDVPVTNAQAMEAVVAGSLGQPRAYTLLVGVFALLAVSLAAVGLYGVVSYTVTQRTHEMGIHMALGAQRGDVFRLVLRQGLDLAIAGIAIGRAGSDQSDRQCEAGRSVDSCGRRGVAAGRSSGGGLFSGEARDECRPGRGFEM
jgi:putative ABC transport system permease protein